MTFVDVNVLLDILLDRAHFSDSIKSISTPGTYCISTVSLSTTMYYVEKYKKDLSAVQTFLDSFMLLSVTSIDAAWAFDNYAGKDYEDALQVACALRQGCTKLVTLDKDLARKYSRDIKVKLIG